MHLLGIRLRKLGAECAQNPRGLIKCGLFTRATPSSILVSLLQAAKYGSKQKGLHTAPAVKGGGEEGRGKDG